MDTIERLFSDNEGNHLVVALYFYDDISKKYTFNLPEDFIIVEIADISIRKYNLEKPLSIKAFFQMCDWLFEQFELFKNAIFCFVCSTDEIDCRNKKLYPQEYRWKLFENLYLRNKHKIDKANVYSKDIQVGPDGYKTYARAFFRECHFPIIHLISSYIKDKYPE